MSKHLPTDHPLRILITRTDRIGDLVLSTPVFAELRKKYPDAWIACLTYCENWEIMKDNPHVDETILYDKKGREKGLVGNLRFASFIKKKKFDAVIHLHATNRMHWMSLLAQVPIRIGWDRRMGWALTKKYAYVKKEGKKHEAEYNFDLLEDFGVACPAKFELHYPLHENSRTSFEELLAQKGISFEKPWIVINPSASDPSKTWAPQEFGALLDQLQEKYDATFIAIGARKDRHYVDGVKSCCQVPIIDLSGSLTLGMLGICLKQAAILISNDSGPVHIAQAVGTPVVSVFVRKEPGINATRWRPLYPENSKFIGPENLNAQQVLSAVETFDSEIRKVLVS